MKKAILYLIYIISIFCFSTAGSAQGLMSNNTHGYQMKLVFPFGEYASFSISTCPTQYKIDNTCCEPPQSIYQYNPTTKGCCTPPNEVLGTGTNERCCTQPQATQERWDQTTTSPCGQFCTQPNAVIHSFARSSCCAPLTPGQNRWGQTATSLCGGHCPTPNVISTYNGFSSCCSNCADAGGVLAFQTVTSVCGTCCSYVPVICGNAGERVCEPTTGSAYCSQNSVCNHPDEWLIGSTGEGGYTCCTSCVGTRYGHTTSSCGQCCSAITHSMYSYSVYTSCCTVETTSQTRYNQTTTNVCGAFCTQPSIMISYGTRSSCCSSCNTNDIRHSQAAGAVCGTCLSCGIGAIPNAEKNACVCDTAGGYIGTWKKDTGSGNGCYPSTCEGKMLAAGFKAEDFTVAGDTITYTGSMNLQTDLDISACHLILKNSETYSLIVNSGKTLKVKSIKSTGMSGLLNMGEVTVTENINVTGSLGIQNSNKMNVGGDIIANGNGKEHGYGVSNSGDLTVQGSIYGTGGEEDHGYGITNTGTIKAKKIIGKTTGKLVGSHNMGVHNRGIMLVDGAVEGTGGGNKHSYGIYNQEGRIEAESIKGIASNGPGNHNMGISNAGEIKVRGEVIGSSSSSGNSTYGISISSTGSIEAKMISGSANIGYGIYNQGKLIATVSISGTSNETYGLNNIGEIDAASAAITGSSGNSNGLYNTKTIEAKTVTGTAGNSGYGIYNFQGTIIASGAITGNGAGTGSGFYNNSGSITGSVIYYCPRKVVGGTYTPEQTCKSGCTCTN